VFSSNQFAAGFFGGIDGLTRQATKAAESAANATERVQRSFARRLQNLNQVLRVGFDKNDFRTTEQQYDNLASRLGGRSALLGAELRASATDWNRVPRSHRRDSV
jgi:hypothetical protein